MTIPDLHSCRARVRRGASSAPEEMERSIERARSAAAQFAFTETAFDDARAQAAAARVQTQALAGLAVSVKDLFDVQGQVTRAGSVVLAGRPAAQRDGTAVARLRAAGAALIGRTNMTEFAFSGVGVNPHYGTPANAAVHDVPRIPGGSSSGAAISVATGAAFLGLGSDTGGSIRIPAALNGLVGFKNTQALTPLDGAIPLSTTLDTACAITRSVRDAVLAHEILAARHVVRSAAPLSCYRFAVIPDLFLDDLEPAVARNFDRTLQRLSRAGARIQEHRLPDIRDVAQLQSGGGLTAAESYAWHRPYLAAGATRYDPRVRTRIERGADMAAADYIDLQRLRQRWMAATVDTLPGFDAVLSPTVPMVAPPLALVAAGEEQDAEFFRINAQLLRNPSVINLLDGCALSLPCQTPGEAPVGLMIWQGAGYDDQILNIGIQIEALLHAV